MSCRGQAHNIYPGAQAQGCAKNLLVKFTRIYQMSREGNVHGSCDVHLVVHHVHITVKRSELTTWMYDFCYLSDPLLL
jgi:hypothetical protein